MPERTRPIGAIGYFLPVKCHALQALRFDGTPRRALSRPRSHEVSLIAVRSGFKPSGTLLGDERAQGSSWRWFLIASLD